MKTARALASWGDSPATGIQLVPRHGKSSATEVSFGGLAVLPGAYQQVSCFAEYVRRLFSGCFALIGRFPFLCGGSVRRAWPLSSEGPVGSGPS